MALACPLWNWVPNLWWPIPKKSRLGLLLPANRPTHHVSKFCKHPFSVDEISCKKIATFAFQKSTSYSTEEAESVPTDSSQWPTEWEMTTCNVTPQCTAALQMQPLVHNGFFSTTLSLWSYHICGKTANSMPAPNYAWRVDWYTRPTVAVRFASLDLHVGAAIWGPTVSARVSRV